MGESFSHFFSLRGGPACPGDRLGGHGCPKTARRDGKPLQISAFHFRLVGGGVGWGNESSGARWQADEEGVGGAVSSGPRNETIAVHVPGTLCHEAAVPKYPTSKRRRCWQRGHGGFKTLTKRSILLARGFRAAPEVQTSSQPVMIPSSMACHARPTSTAEVHHGHHLPCVSGTWSATSVWNEYPHAGRLGHGWLRRGITETSSVRQPVPE